MLLLCCSPPENIQYFNNSKYSAASALLDLTPLFASIQILYLSRFHSVMCYIDIGQVIKEIYSQADEIDQVVKKFRG